MWKKLPDVSGASTSTSIELHALAKRWAWEVWVLRQCGYDHRGYYLRHQRRRLESLYEYWRWKPNRCAISRSQAWRWTRKNPYPGSWRQDLSNLNFCQGCGASRREGSVRPRTTASIPWPTERIQDLRRHRSKAPKVRWQPQCDCLRTWYHHLQSPRQLRLHHDWLRWNLWTTQ